MNRVKKLVICLLLIIAPIKVLAYNQYIIPGGKSLGIDVKTDGILIIGFYKVNGKFIKGDNELKVGDYITKINDHEVQNVTEMLNIIEQNPEENLHVEFNRKGKTYYTNIKLEYENDKYKTGLYVKDSIKGCGTLSFIIPESGIYGALGHEIIEANSNEIVEIRTGQLYENVISSIDKSTPGHAGSKISETDYSKIIGSITKNTKYGIFGLYDEDISKEKLIEIGKPIIGKAFIRTVIKDDKVENFKVDIIKINETSEYKNITIEITDQKLLEATGGVVQGMSGSPIIQNDKIVGVLTHVIVDRPALGYGILISKMLEEGEK